MKNVLIIGASLVVLGIIFIVGGYLLAGRKLSGFNSKNNSHVEKTYECKGNIENIRVNERSDHLRVESGDVDKVLVTYYDRKDKELYDIKEDGTTLVVKRNEEKDFSLFQIDFTDKATVITVPREYDGALELHTSSGGMELNDITATDLTADNKSGSVKLNNVTADSVKVHNTSGSIKLENVTSGSDISVENTSGSITFTNVTADGDLKAKGSSGSIRLESLYAAGNINITNTSGSIKGTIHGKESDYKIKAKTTSGGCNLTDSDSGSRELNVKTTSGGIKIDFEN